MLKTNCKEVKSRIRQYLKENVAELLEEREVETDKPFTSYFSIIQKEKFYQSYPSDFEMFKDWLQGLGGFGADIYCSGSETYHDKCKEILATWLDQSKEEVEKYSSTESENLMVHLCWREFSYMMRKEMK